MIAFRILRFLRPLTIALVLICAAVATLAWQRITSPVPSWSEDSARSTAGIMAPADDLLLPDPAGLASYAEILERPLFSAERRPPRPDEVVEPVRSGPTSPPPDPPTVELTGVIIVADARYALLGEAHGGDRFRVREGEELKGWRVQEVADASVTLALGEQSVELMLMRNDPAARPRAAAMPGRAQQRAHPAPDASEGGGSSLIDRLQNALERLPAMGLDPVEERRRQADLEQMLEYELRRSRQESVEYYDDDD